MHNEVLKFLEERKRSHPDVFRAKRVIEAGSLDVNGTPRRFFECAEIYRGVDWRPGPGVDRVSLFHVYKDDPDGFFDVCISTEMLEHDPSWRASLRRMYELVRVGGSVLITCAGPGRERHHVETSPGSSYYENRTSSEILAILGNDWESILAQEDQVAHDTRIFLQGKH